jgi:hypothetical protein
MSKADSPQGPSRDRPVTDEVISREMISAGVSALDFWGESAPAEKLVEEIYKAKLKCRQGPKA